MSPSSRKPIVFISYSHADEPERPAEGEVRWLSFVVGNLRPAEKHNAVEIWIDRLMPGGANWELEIEHKLRACDVFILLVSNHSMASDYVGKEVAVVRERQANGEDVHFYPLVLTPTTKVGLESVRDKNLRPRDGQPFSRFSPHDRHEKMCEAADEIVEIANQIVERERMTVALASTVREGVPEIADRLSLRAWLEDQGVEAAIAIAARAALRVAPLVNSFAGKRPNDPASRRSFRAASAVFRCSALAWVAGKYPTNANDVRSSAAAATEAAYAASKGDGALLASASVISSAATACRAAEFVPFNAFAASEAAGFASAAADEVAAASSSGSIWNEIQADIATLRTLGPNKLLDRPLWSQDVPPWVYDACYTLRETLPGSEDWDVWTQWYQERLDGGLRDEKYEFVFATVPSKNWEAGPKSANAWIRDQLSRLNLDRVAQVNSDGQTGAGPENVTRQTFLQWLLSQKYDVAAAIAIRAALRVLPFVAGHEESGFLPATTARRFVDDIGILFRSEALSWNAANFMSRREEFRQNGNFVGATLAASNLSDRISAHLAALGRASGGDLLLVESAQSTAPILATVYALRAAASDGAFESGMEAGLDASLLPVRNAAEAVEAASVGIGTNAADALNHFWVEALNDARLVAESGDLTLLGVPLWSAGLPPTVGIAWRKLHLVFPPGEDWEVWLDWYEDRLFARERSETYELTFARVPQRIWGESSAAANAWIRAHLPEELPRGSSRSSSFDLPAPLPNADAPYVYTWNAALRVAAVAGPQNLPFYPYFSSEEDHRHSLGACRKGAERLLKALREGQYHNVRSEYAGMLQYYVEDLPQAAGEGNILLANDQMVILREMSGQDADSLPAPFAVALKRVIENQFALNAFYDLVGRHAQAVAASNWEQPFPSDAAKSFFGAVEEETPRFFEPQVSQGLRRIERAAPPVAAVSEGMPSASSIKPAPLPLGTPDPRHSHERQMATAANALWETFLKGKDLPLAIEAWTETAEKLGRAIGPILDFLRGLGN